MTYMLVYDAKYDVWRAIDENESVLFIIDLDRYLDGQIILAVEAILLDEAIPEA